MDRFCSFRPALLLLLLLLPMGAGATNSRADALDREADVYLVPIGSLPEDLLPELADYYRQVLGLDAVVTGALPFDPAMRDDQRKQLIAEELLTAIGRGFRGWARNRRALFIGITGSDMYAADMNWRFAFAVRRGAHLSVVSGARMADRPHSTGAWSTDRVARLRKMVTKTIAVQTLGLPSSSDPTSVLYGRVFGPADLDRIDENTLYRDVIEPAMRRKRREPPLDSDDPLSLEHPVELRVEDDQSGRTMGWLIMGGIGLFAALAIASGISIQRRTRLAWRAVAARHGWRLVDAAGPWYNRGSRRIELDIDGVSVIVDSVIIGGYRNRIEQIRIQGDISCPHDFRIVQESLYTRIQKRLGRLVKVEIGDSTYDRAYLVMCTAEDWIRQHLPLEVRARQLALRAMLFAENGRLEVRRFPMANNEEDLLSLIQVFADAAAAIRERTAVEIAPALSTLALPPLPEDEARSRVWAKHTLRILLAVGVIELVGFFPLQRMIGTEETSAAWQMSLPWAGGLALVVLIGWFARGRLTLSSLTFQQVLGAIGVFFAVSFGYWSLSGPWVMGWNAMVGRPHPEGLYGPVLEKRIRKPDRSSLVLQHPGEDRRVRIPVTGKLFETVRLGDPMRLKVRQGSLGFYYWLRE